MPRAFIYQPRRPDVDWWATPRWCQGLHDRWYFLIKRLIGLRSTCTLPSRTAARIQDLLVEDARGSSEFANVRLPKVGGSIVGVRKHADPVSKKSQSNLEKKLLLLNDTLRHVISQNKSAPYRGRSRLRLIHRTMGPLDPPPQTAAGSLQPFLRNTRSLLTNIPTHRQNERGTRSLKCSKVRFFHSKLISR